MLECTTLALKVLKNLNQKNWRVNLGILIPSKPSEQWLQNSAFWTLPSEQFIQDIAFRTMPYDPLNLFRSKAFLEVQLTLRHCHAHNNIFVEIPRQMHFLFTQVWSLATTLVWFEALASTQSEICRRNKIRSKAIHEVQLTLRHCHLHTNNSVEKPRQLQFLFSQVWSLATTLVWFEALASKNQEICSRNKWSVNLSDFNIFSVGKSLDTINNVFISSYSTKSLCQW